MSLHQLDWKWQAFEYVLLFERLGKIDRFRSYRAVPCPAEPSLAAPWIARENAQIYWLNCNTFKMRSCFCIWGYVHPPVSWSVHPVRACKGMGAGEGVRRGKRRLAWPNLLQSCLPNLIALPKITESFTNFACCLEGWNTLSGQTAAFQEKYQHLLRLHPHWLLFWGPILTLRISPKSVNLASSYSRDLGNLKPQPQC